MTTSRIPLRRTFTVLAAALTLSWGAAAQAHCDTLDGPVVGAGRNALDSGNVNLALGWVQKSDEAEIRAAFAKARSVRNAGGVAQELADRYFFETLVRVHRAGEGAPYTGLKPAGTIEPSVAAADRALETGQLEPVAKLVTERMHDGLHRQFETAMAKKPRDSNDVAAVRAYAGAYTEYVHYVERLYDTAGAGAHAQDKPAAGRAAVHAH